MQWTFREAVTQNAGCSSAHWATLLLSDSMQANTLAGQTIACAMAFHRDRADEATSRHPTAMQLRGALHVSTTCHLSSRRHAPAE